MDALTKMKRTGRSRLIVVDDGRLTGVIALKDLLDFLSVKLELDVEDAAPFADRDVPPESQDEVEPTLVSR